MAAISEERIEMLRLLEAFTAPRATTAIFVLVMFWTSSLPRMARELEAAPWLDAAPAN